MKRTTMGADATRYRTIVADPPWEYEGGFNGFGSRRALPYESMTLDQIAAVPMADLLEREGYLFVWATNRYLAAALSLVPTWGFSYRQTVVWDKGEGSGGLGGMFASTAEFVVIAQNIRPGTNAHGARTLRTRHPEAVLRFPRQGEHSRKPDAFLDLVERLCPGPYLEMFSRRARLGWQTWGDEALHGTEAVA